MRYQNTLQKWDVVVLQGNSTETISKKESTRKNFVDSATQMAEMAHKAGAKLSISWPGRRKLNPKIAKAGGCLYLHCAKRGYVAPVGLAFVKARKTHPKLTCIIMMVYTLLFLVHISPLAYSSPPCTTSLLSAARFLLIRTWPCHRQSVTTGSMGNRYWVPKS